MRRGRFGNYRLIVAMYAGIILPFTCPPTREIMEEWWGRPETQAQVDQALDDTGLFVADQIGDVRTVVGGLKVFLPTDQPRNQGPNRKSTSTAGGGGSGAVIARNDREQWAIDIAKQAGNDNPSPELVAFLVGWQRAEGGKAQNNPFNTTLTRPGNTCYNSLKDMPCGVKNYPSREVGLEATISTLEETWPGYADILAGIKTNDPERSLRGLYDSPWGTHAALAETTYREELTHLPEVSTGGAANGAAPASAPPKQGEAVSPPIGVAGEDPFPYNIRNALDANGGSLRNFVISPGQTWSFNDTIGLPPMKTIVNPGDGWCDLASRYYWVALDAGLPDGSIGKVLHDKVLAGLTYERSLAIWTDGNPATTAGEQDLVITNTDTRPLHFRAIDNGDGTVSIAASFADPAQPLDIVLQAAEIWESVAADPPLPPEGADSKGNQLVAGPEDGRPWGNPLNDRAAIITQGYGVGTHAPAATWGGVDLAIDANGDGAAEPGSTQGHPIYATLSGDATVSLDTWPGGNCVLIRGGDYRTTNCHMQTVTIQSGPVVRGQQIGTVGSTGNSTGAHLHYEVWRGEVNQDPTGYGVLESAQ